MAALRGSGVGGAVGQLGEGRQGGGFLAEAEHLGGGGHGAGREVAGLLDALEEAVDEGGVGGARDGSLERTAGGPLHHAFDQVAEQDLGGPVGAVPGQQIDGRHVAEDGRIEGTAAPGADRPGAGLHLDGEGVDDAVAAGRDRHAVGAQATLGALGVGPLGGGAGALGVEAGAGVVGGPLEVPRQPLAGLAGEAVDDGDAGGEVGLEEAGAGERQGLARVVADLGEPHEGPAFAEGELELAEADGGALEGLSGRGPIAAAEGEVAGADVEAQPELGGRTIR